jgi:hypothetical protein
MDDLSSYSSGADRPAAAHDAVIPGDAPAAPAIPEVEPATPPNPGRVDAPSPALELPSPDALPAALARVTSYSPEDGATGVPGSAGLTITFAQSMDTVSVRAAFESATLPLDAATFTWSDADTRLHVDFDPPLAEAEGTDPRILEPLCQRYRIEPSAIDASRHPLEASEVGFCTRRRIRQAFSSVLDRDLSGNWRSDGAYGDGDCLREGTALCVGDSGFAPNQQYRGFLSFDLSSVPAPALEVTRAVLQLTLRSSVGRPFPDLGPLRLEAVEFDAIGEAAFSVDALAGLDALVSEAGADAISLVDVTPAVSGAAGGLSQYRLRFETATDSDFTSDHVMYEQAAELRVDYFTP